MAGDPLAEYKDLSDNLRHNGVRRDARLTLYFAVAGGLVLLIFSQSQFAISSDARSMLEWGAILVTIAFLFIELRLWKTRTAYLDRARELEKDPLGFQQYGRLNRRLELVPVSAILYGLFLLFWLWVTFVEQPAPRGTIHF